MFSSTIPEFEIGIEPDTSLSYSKSYGLYFNQQRPHQGIAQCLPVPSMTIPADSSQCQTIAAQPVLGGLHTVYRLAVLFYDFDRGGCLDSS